MKTELYELLKILSVSIVAAFIRFLGAKREHMVERVTTFAGGVLFGSLVGYVSSSSSIVAPYSHILTAAAALTSKDAIAMLIKELPKLLKSILNRFQSK
jgi:hypothetical protein